MKWLWLKLFLYSFIVWSFSLSAQTRDSIPDTRSQIPDSAFDDMGVSVSPSSMHLTIKPGTNVIKEIKVANDTKQLYKFQVGFNDFEMGRNGKPLSLKPTEGKYGLSKWINVSPSYFELKPGERINLKVIVDIPDAPEAYRSAWTIVTVEQVIDRPPLDEGDHPKRVAFGINPTFGFGVYVYQTPPNVVNDSLSIEKFAFHNEEGKKRLEMIVKNLGDGIGYCYSYVELTSLSTGDQKKLQVKRFTILPGFYRNFYYELPKDMPAGKYNAVGVVDFGNAKKIIAAETEFEIP